MSHCDRDADRSERGPFFPFETYSRVLIRLRDEVKGRWFPHIYLFYLDDNHFVVGGMKFHDGLCDILPYEGFEYLAGTSSMPPKPYEPEPGELVAVSDDGESWEAGIFEMKDDEEGHAVYYCRRYVGAGPAPWRYIDKADARFKLPTRALI